jgi:PHD/YefM family antitoxin component YafN of YafNO toxin-antitoxin module
MDPGFRRGDDWSDFLRDHQHLILSILGDSISSMNSLKRKGGIMPIIKPISSLRNQTRNIATLCHEQDEPVYLTTNGEGDLVVMSIEHYERLKARVELFGKLAVAQAQVAAGEKGLTHSQVIKKLRQRLHGK